MNLWLAVLGLCVLLCGQGAVAMHLQSSPPPFPGAPPNSISLISGGSSRSSSSSSKRDSDGLPLATRWTGGGPSLAAAPYNSHSGSGGKQNLFNLKSSNSSSGSSNISASDLDKKKHNQLDKNFLYRIWRRRRQLETLRRQRRRMQALAPRHVQMPSPVQNILVHDTRPGTAVRTKRDSRFGRYTPRMFQPSLVSPQPPPLSSQGPMHLHPKLYSPSPSMPSAVASPQLTSARERLGFDVPQQQQLHSHRQATAAALGSSHQATPTTSHNSMLNKPKDQHGLPGSSTVPIPYTKPVLGTAHHHSAQHSVPVSPSHNIHQQHNSTHNHNHNHNNGGGGGHKGPLLPMKGRKYCSARDPANLAFEAGVVFEGRVHSMSIHNYSVTFQVVKVHKTQPGFGQVPSHIRIHFRQVKSLDCDLHRENFRNPAHIRGKLEQGKMYFIFGRFIEQNNFTVIGQPMRTSEKHQREVRNGLSETYGELWTRILFIYTTYLLLAFMGQ